MTAWRWGAVPLALRPPPSRDEFVLGRVQAPGGPAEPDRRSGPQCRVAPGGVEVPAHAAAGGPHRRGHPPLDVVAPGLLGAGPGVESGGAGAVQRGEVVDDVVELGLDHVDHRVVAQARVGPDHHAQVREARDRGAAQRAHVAVPDLREAAPVRPKSRSAMGASTAWNPVARMIASASHEVPSLAVSVLPSTLASPDATTWTFGRRSAG